MPFSYAFGMNSNFKLRRHSKPKLNPNKSGSALFLIWFKQWSIFWSCRQIRMSLLEESSKQRSSTNCSSYSPMLLLTCFSLKRITIKRNTILDILLGLCFILLDSLLCARALITNVFLETIKYVFLCSKYSGNMNYSKKLFHAIHHF